MKTLVFACAVSVAEAVAAATLRPGMTDVVVAEGATPTVRFAAAELTNFLGRVLGTPVPIVPRPTTGRSAVILGENAWSRESGIDVGALARDGFRCVAEGERVCLAGHDDPKADPARLARGQGPTMFERATLFAVYDFLERFAGCRFFFPGELGTVVPRREKIEIPAGRVRSEPVFSERYYAGHQAGELWPEAGLSKSAMHGLNRLRLRYGTQRMPCCHGQRQFRYVPRFAKEHPDWFCLQKNGERYLTDTGTSPHYKNGKLCYSSPIREEIYRDVKAYLTGQPAASRGLKAWAGNCVNGRYVDIMPEDSLMECHCPKCQAAYDKGEKMYATEFIWGMTAEIASRLTREGIAGDICQMAYPPYRRVPRVKLPPNVQVMVAEEGPWSVRKAGEFQAQLDEVRAWSEKLGHKVWLWTYPGKYGNKYADCPQISPRAYAKFFREMAPWIRGGYIETFSDRFAYDLLNVYVYARLAWDPHLDVEALIADWHDKLFGRGAPYMKRAFDRLEEIWMGDVQSQPTVETEVGPVTPECSYADLCTKIYSEARVGEIAALFDKAVSAVVPGTREARVVGMFRREMLDPLVARVKNSSVEEELRRRAARPDRSILRNGTLDASLDGWSASIADAPVVRDAQVRIQGDASVRLTTSTGADPKRYTRVSFEQPLKLVVGKRYRLSYFLKAENVVPYHKGEGAGVCLWEGRDLYTKHPHPLVTGTCDWLHLCHEFTARAETGRLQFRICESTGTVWVDGIRLEPVEDGFREKPLWTAGIVSDTHVGRTRKSCELVEKACALFAARDVDLFVHCGDIADRHYPEAYPILRTMTDAAFPRNPAKKLWVAAYHDVIDRSQESWQTVMSDVWRLLKADNRFYELVDFKGCPLIVLPQWWHDSASGRAKVREMLDAACAKHPTGPICVFDHVPGLGTTENSLTWGNWQRRLLYAEYPRIIHVCGHTHGSLRSELNVWQGEYTAVNMSCLQVWEGSCVGMSPSPKKNFGAVIMEVYPTHVDFRRFDVRTGREYGAGEVWSIPVPFDSETAPYRRDLASRREPVPQFPEDAALAVRTDRPFTGATLAIPEAVSPHGTYLYKILIMTEKREPVTWFETFGQFYLTEGERSEATGVRLNPGYFDPGRMCRIRVTPANCFGGEGRAIETAFVPPAAADGLTVFESNDPVRDCPFLTGLADGGRLSADAQGWYSIGDGNYRLEFPSGVWEAAKGARFRFVLDMETQQDGPRTWTLVLRNPNPLENANERISTPSGESGRMRYVIDFAKRKADYRYYLLVREGGNGRIRFNRVRIERVK